MWQCTSKTSNGADCDWIPKVVAMVLIVEWIKLLCTILVISWVVRWHGATSAHDDVSNGLVFLFCVGAKVSFIEEYGHKVNKRGGCSGTNGMWQRSQICLILCIVCKWWHWSVLVTQHALRCMANGDKTDSAYVDNVRWQCWMINQQSLVVGMMVTIVSWLCKF